MIVLSSINTTAVRVGTATAFIMTTTRITTAKTDNHQQHRSIFSSSSSLLSSSSISYEEGNVSIFRKNDDNEQIKFSIYYRIYNNNKNPKEQHPTTAIPLLVLHGGPSLPSQYLYPMVHHIKNRPIIFYDQLGCGESDEPINLNYYSISQFVDDIESILNALGIPKVHVFGHSFGGVLAYEYYNMKLQQQQQYNFPSHSSTSSSSNSSSSSHTDDNDTSTENAAGVNIESLILANTPMSMKQSGDAYDTMAAKKGINTFWMENVCRIKGTNDALEDAMANVGRVWSGMDVVLDYIVQTQQQQLQEQEEKDIIINPIVIPPTLIIRGRHDFCFEASEGWKALFLSLVEQQNEKHNDDKNNAPSISSLHATNNDKDNNNNDLVQEVILEDCAHYPHLEDGPKFGQLIQDFISKTPKN